MTGRRGCCWSGAVAGRLDALWAEDGGGAIEAEGMRGASVVDEAAAADTNCSGGMRGERLLPRMTVRLLENPGIAGSSARALADIPEGRDDCCAAKPGSRDLGPCEGMYWMVEFAMEEIYPMKRNAKRWLKFEGGERREAKW